MTDYYKRDTLAIECDRILGCGGEGIILKLKFNNIDKEKPLAFKFTKCNGLVRKKMGSEEYFRLLRQLGEYNAHFFGLGDYLAFGLSDIFDMAYNVIGTSKKDESSGARYELQL